MKRLLVLLSMSACALGFAQSPERIVSASGNASQVIADLGLADNLVAVDTTSLLPPEVMAKKPKIGYRRHLSAEGILSMTPDLVILAPDAGPPTVVKQLQESGVNIFYLEDKQTLEGINQDILRLGKALNALPAAQKLVEQQKVDAEHLAKDIAAYPYPPRLLLLLDTGNGLFGLGQDSAGAHMAHILGATAALDFTGMKPISDEALATTNADAILIARRSDAEDMTVVRKLPKGQYHTLDISPTMEKGCVFEVNIMKTLGFGSGTAKVADDIVQAIKPCIATKTEQGA